MLIEVVQVDHVSGGIGEDDLGIDREVLVDMDQLAGGEGAPAGIVVHPLAFADGMDGFPDFFTTGGYTADLGEDLFREFKELDRLEAGERDRASSGHRNLDRDRSLLLVDRQRELQ